eukprot:Hpha_TRINITY_DN16111_c6_g2::TRINITY_DN16111_c6_g2_i8::g.5489::m.5489
MGELQVFARLQEGQLVAVSVAPAGTVGDLMKEVRQAAGLRTAPKLRFLGKTLDPSMAVADTGVTSEAVVELVSMGMVTVPISAYWEHCLAVVEGGTKVQAWGLNEFGQCTIPDLGGVNVVQVAAGGFHSMALMEDQTVRAWGCNNEGQCTIPDFDGLQVLQIAAGGNHSMALMCDH